MARTDAIVLGAGNCRHFGGAASRQARARGGAGRPAWPGRGKTSYGNTGIIEGNNAVRPCVPEGVWGAVADCAEAGAGGETTICRRCPASRRGWLAYRAKHARRNARCKFARADAAPLYARRGWPSTRR